MWLRLTEKIPCKTVPLKSPLAGLVTALVSAVLMPGSPAVAHELSGSTCAADVVFLWDQKFFSDCGLHGGTHHTAKDGHRLRAKPKSDGSVYCGGPATMVSRPDDPAADAHGRVTVDGRGNLLYGHTKAVIDELLARGADVRFGTANQFIDPAVTLAIGHYGNVGIDGTRTSGAFHPTGGRARIAHGE